MNRLSAIFHVRNILMTPLEKNKAVEVFVALSVSVYLFFLLIPQAAAPRLHDGDITNAYLFSYLSHHPSSTNDLANDYPMWKTRLAGPVITGKTMDMLWTSDWFAFDRFKFPGNSLVFAAYHTAWVLLTFVILIWHRREALLPILGTFAGLMYNFIVPSGEWFFPWDYPIMFFFTWSCLLFLNQNYWQMLMVIAIGSTFKETAACAAVLIFWANGWSIRKRIISFIGVCAACYLVRRLLMFVYGVMVPALQPQYSLWENLENLSSPILNHPIWTNAGALFLILMLPAKREMVPIKIVAAIFAAGQFLFGDIIEFREWYELLPMGWILVGDYVKKNLSDTEPSLESSPTIESGRRVGHTIFLLITSTLLLAAAGNHLLKSKFTPPEVNNNLAWSLATNPDAAKRNGLLAVKLAEDACQRTQYRITIMIGTLAAAYAEAGRFDDAISAAQKAIALASQSGDRKLLEENQKLLTLYLNHQPYHESQTNLPRLLPGN